MPKIPENLIPTNPVYEKFLKFLKSQRDVININQATPGAVYELGKGKLQILGPVRTNYDNLNDFSVVCRFELGNSSFFFGGDAQKAAELDLINSGQNLKSKVLKLNHHGSRTSNTKQFLKAVDAKIYVATVGRNNSYHHPHDVVLKRILNSKKKRNKHNKHNNNNETNNKLYRTDLNGSIVFTVDDDFIGARCEKGE